MTFEGILSAVSKISYCFPQAIKQLGTLYADGVIYLTLVFASLNQWDIALSPLSRIYVPRNVSVSTSNSANIWCYPFKDAPCIDDDVPFSAPL